MSSLHGRSLEMKQGEREAQTSSGAQTGRMPRLKGCLVNRQEQERRGLSWERQREMCETRIHILHGTSGSRGRAGRKEEAGTPGTPLPGRRQ